MARPMLGEIELELVQKIETEDDQVLRQHGVPALEGDFLQRQGRRASRIKLSGVMTGTEAAESLKTLRAQYREGQTVSFVADIATATQVDEVLIEEFGAREIAGKAERFAYELTLREFLPPPRPEVEPPPPEPIEPVNPTVGTLVIEVVVEGESDFDVSAVAVTVEGIADDQTAVNRTLTDRTGNVWTDANMLEGRFTATARTGNRSGTASAQIRPGQTTQVTITLRSVSTVATKFIIHFRFDKAFVEPCLRPVLREAVAYASAHPDEKLLIVGHTDKVGSDVYNQSLSERRARTVYAFLTFGVDRAASVAEWSKIRENRVPQNELPTLEDNWGAREYQQILQDLLFYPGKIDGDHGRMTDDAVSAYRCHKGLPPGTQVDDEVWEALITDYLEQDNFGIPPARFFPNCGSEVVKWVGCGEEDPVNPTGTPHRPNRRTELLFVRADRIPCEVTEPVTFNLTDTPPVNADWCLDPNGNGKRCCFVTPYPKPRQDTPPPQCSSTPGGPWCRVDADPRTLTLRGSIKREDGTPLRNQQFVVIAPKGNFLRGEDGAGNGSPANTDSNGKFDLGSQAAGFYSLELRVPERQPPMLARNALERDETIRGGIVCKELRADPDRFDVVVIDAPPLREIRLPVAVHLMTALHPTTREVRTCPLQLGGRAPQATALTNAQVRAAFDEANRIWRQGRVRFTLDDADIVREFYSFRTECEVDGAEFAILLERCGTPDAINVFFVGDLLGAGEAGFGISPEDAAAAGLPFGGCAVGDRFQANLAGLPVDITLDDPLRAQVLAHEFGHFLNLEHAVDTSANESRLMFPRGADGSNRTLTPDEVALARTSQAAADDCVPLTLTVTGATRVGGSLSNHFILVQDAAATVTVEAQIPDRLLDPAVGALTTPRQQTVSGATTGVTEVVATYAPAGGGTVVTARAIVRVVTFRLRVDGATQIGGADSTDFVTRQDPNQKVTIIAEIAPEPFCVPETLLTWVKGDAAPDPLRRVLSKANIAQTTIEATLAGVTRSVTIRIVAVDFVANAAPFDTKLDRAQIEGVLNANLASLDRGDLFGTQPDSLVVVRADLPGTAGDTVQATLFSNPPAGVTLETLPITLRRLNAGSDRFVSLPLLALPAAIQRSEITMRTPQDLVVIRARAGGRFRVEINVPLPAVFRTVEVRVRGRVVHIAAQTFVDAKTTSKDLKATAADVRRQIGRANRIWAQAGIEIKERSIQDSVPDPKNLLSLDHEDPFTKFTTDERVLLGLDPGGPAYSAVATDLNVFYVQEIQGPPSGLSFKGIPAPGHVVTAIEGPLVTDAALAHEIGHQMLVGWNSPSGTGSDGKPFPAGDEHVDLTGKEWPETNVLHRSDVDSNGDVDRTQVQNILTGVGTGPFVIFEQ